MSHAASSRRLAVSAFILLGAFAPANGALITVNTTTDEVTTNASCSLREAVSSANTDTAVGGCARGSGADEIRLPAGTYTLSYMFDSDGGSRDLDLKAGTLTITGAGAASTVIDGNGLVPSPVAADRVIEVWNGAVVTISGVTIRNGVSPNGGGGIANLIGAKLQLIDSIVTDNTAPDGAGGISNGGQMAIVGSIVEANTATVAAGEGAGIRNSANATLLIERSIVRGNRAPGTDGRGGGIANEGTLTVRATTITGNEVLGTRGAGGGIANSAATAAAVVVTLDDTTIEGNQAGANGGGIENTRTLTLTNCTVSGNEGDDGAGVYTDSNLSVVLNNVTLALNSGRGLGGGIFNQSATPIELANTIVAGNVATGTSGGPAPDCAGAHASRGHNLVGNGANCDLTAAAGDQVGTAAAPIDARIDPLADNGGPTRTHALRDDSSPAVDAGNPQGCRDALGDPIPTDQRGFMRPEGPGGVCDVGAFEFGSSLPPTTTTTIPGGTVTTTTLPCSPASCDDGDPCTTDACTPGCTRTPKSGGEGMTCAFRGGLQVVACAGQKVPKAIGKQFTSAGKQADQAAATSGKKARKRAKRALALLKLAEKAATKAKVSAECRNSLLAPIRSARRGAETFLATQ